MMKWKGPQVEVEEASPLEALLARPHLAKSDTQDLREAVPRLEGIVKQQDDTIYQLHCRLNSLERRRQMSDDEAEISVCAICGRPQCGHPERVAMRSYRPLAFLY